MKYTSGPWTVDEESFQPVICGAIRDDGFEPAVAIIRIGLKETPANTRLIAACPELVEALKSIAHTVELPLELESKSRAALRKAGVE